MHNAIMAEFGDSQTDEYLGAETLREATMPVGYKIPAAEEEDIIPGAILSQPPGIEAALGGWAM